MLGLPNKFRGNLAQGEKWDCVETKPAQVPPIAVGTRVRVKAREWRGIPRPGFSGKLVAWERDSKGIYAVVEHRGERILARPENVRAA